MLDEAKSILDQIQKMVREEARLQRDILESQWRLPLHERVYRGKAIESLSYAGISEENGNAILACETNNALFREGDVLFLHKGNPLDEKVISCILESDDDHFLEVSVEDADLKRLDDDPDGWIADEGYISLLQLYLEAISEVAERDIGRSRILPLLTGNLRPRADVTEYEKAYAEALGCGLNESQAEATAQATATDLVYLIQGPPGTGKTLVIAHITRRLVAAGERVFITSFTHRAINNALNKVAILGVDFPVCKIGPRSRANDLKVVNCERFLDSELTSADYGYAIGATPFATRTRRLSGVQFDTVIFDEASQVTLPLAIMGMLAAKRYIFVGDDKQLPPVVISKGVSPLSGTSIFGLLSGRGYESMLDVTYRMNEKLTKWPSFTFYAGKLQPALQVKDRVLQLNSSPSSFSTILDSGQPVVFVDLRTLNTRTRSWEEAKLASELLVALMQAGVPPIEIGVVTPYRAQGREIRKHLNRAHHSRSMNKQIVIDTVERMQGQEREVILVSLATSDPSFAAQLAEFFFQPNRLNVTVTRARTKLIILGSSEVLKTDRKDTELEKLANYLRTFLKSCSYINAFRA